MENALWRQWNIPSWFIAPMEKAWFYIIFSFEVVMVIVKIKENKIKMSIKISFMHYTM